MKAQLEKIMLPEGGSWCFLLRDIDAIPFEWHFHPEYELTLTLNESGERYVGDSIEGYQQSDLVLVGPNLPHTWQSAPSVEYTEQKPLVFVLWFSQQWVDQLVQQFPEYAELPKLLQKSYRGIKFKPELAQVLTESFTSLAEASVRERLIILLSILDALLEQPMEMLASYHFQTDVVDNDHQDVLNHILFDVHQNFSQLLTLEMMASRANMSVSTFVRFFKRHMKQSFNQYLTQIRLGHACQLLIRSQKPITFIAEESGFHNQSNFNRLFKKYKGMTPAKFRDSFRNKSMN
ncbi:AraC family transcriptional regulator [Vibrio rumoiensis]|uniref:HTH araC/xylS-type domain-containing protein n=1 Tax=Vibrio rumoiensis 1S-45 TaxID=1188252 RepID=A0A1E5E4J0_9VIBR|nr:helix-turn-helix domain-containing protein [Vibrio rumoiensis]OEF27751.1 hypothetical protein A1QC_14370 [Vibrio rumoiensis 1S-45]